MSQVDGSEPTIGESPAPEVVVVPEPAGAPDVGDALVIRVDEARRRSLRRWAIATGVLLAIAVLAVSLTATPLFHAKTIRVQGASRLSERQVVRAAGVDAQTNVFSLDEEAVARTLERNPWIADALVTTSLPSTIRITVSERAPVGLTRTDDGVVMVAGDGSVLGPSASGGLPEIRMPDDDAVGQPSPVPAPLLTAAATAAAEFGSSLRPQIESIVVLPDGSITLNLRDGVTVAYGGPTEIQAKAEALRAILDYAHEEGKELIDIDLRTPSAPTARFVGTPVVMPVLTDEPQGDRPKEDHRPSSSSSPTPAP